MTNTLTPWVKFDPSYWADFVFLLVKQLHLSLRHMQSIAMIKHGLGVINGSKYDKPFSPKLYGGDVTDDFFTLKVAKLVYEWSVAWAFLNYYNDITWGAGSLKTRRKFDLWHIYFDWRQRQPEWAALLLLCEGNPPKQGNWLESGRWMNDNKTR